MLKSLTATVAGVMLGALAFSHAQSQTEAEQTPTEAAMPLEDGETQIGEVRPGYGPVTNLPLPRFVSLKTSEGNARRGPSLTHRIDWVFRHRDMPLLVTAEFGHWRRVEDRDGQGGWIHYSLLSGVRTIVVESDMAELHDRPDPASPVDAKAQAGAVARLGDCTFDWCEIRADGLSGWIAKTDIWGVGPDEIRD